MADLLKNRKINLLNYNGIDKNNPVCKNPYKPAFAKQLINGRSRCEQLYRNQNK